MLIRRKRIRNLDRYMRTVERGSPVVIGLAEPHRMHPRLQQIGFSEAMEPGERVLPAELGPVSRYNAEGDYIVHKDQPMETAYRQIMWHWREFRGRYDYEEKWDVRDVPYKRYPRTFRPPPSVELAIAARSDESKYVVCDPVTLLPANEEELLHRVNLFLELFGEAETLTEDLEGYIVVQVRRLNWDVLPPGQHPWPRLQEHLRPHIDRAPEGNRPVLVERLQAVNEYGPMFTAVGRAGFSGYIIFGFPDQNMFVLESLYYGNATYVFDERWEELSRRTKAQVLGGNLEVARIVHRRGWKAKLDEVLASEPAEE